ncbi:MAG: fibronectin/fibrinogen-binding protein [Clostridiales bacterium]|nr:fibronectin/fibrinogen-binding protein [Clostridiales bacterium]
MPQDAVTTFRVAQDLHQKLSGGKINKINQPGKEELIFSVYTQGLGTHRVKVSANASFCRVGFSDLAEENPAVCPSFCMLLRKHLSGGVIESVTGIPGERVIRFTVKSYNDFMEEVEKELTVEVMGKYSNVFLTENGKILGTLKTATLEESSKRAILTGMAYALPPAQDKTPLWEESAVAEILLSITGELTETLFNRLKGLCFLSAQELAFALKERGFTPPFTPETARKGASLIATFFENAPLNPCVLWVNGKTMDFFPFPYRSLSGTWVFYENLLEAQNAFYTKKEGDFRFSERTKRLLSVVKKQETKLNRRLSVIAAKEKDCADMENLRKKGELLTCNLWQIKENTDKVTLPDYYAEEGATVTITLDKTLSPKKNAEKLFKRYDKAKKTLLAIAPQRAEAEKDLRYLDTVKSLITRAEKNEDFVEIEAELTSQGLLKSTVKGKKKGKEPPVKPHRYTVNGFHVAVGKNNLQNDTLTADAETADVWLHTKDYHSAHVVIATHGKTVPEDVLTVAAEICAHHSSARGAGKIPVDYTLKKYVKKPTGAKPGFVIYTNQKTLIVESNPHENLKNG